MRLALDTNVLVYAEGLERGPTDLVKIALANRLVAALGLKPFVIARQSLGELYSVLVRKGAETPAAAAVTVRRWRDRAEVAETTAAVFELALDIAGAHRFAIFDAIILAAAVESRCDLLLSEDLHDGFAFRGVTVVNPFARTLEPRLARLLA